MAEEYHSRRSRELVKATEDLGAFKTDKIPMPSDSLKIIIKQEGILLRLMKPTTELVRWVAVALTSMFEEDRND